MKDLIRKESRDALAHATSKVSSVDSPASLDQSILHELQSFFDQSSLSNTYSAIQMSKLELQKGFRGFIRLKNDIYDGVIYFDWYTGEYKRLSLTFSEREEYDREINSQENPTFLSPASLQVISLITGFHPDPHPSAVYLGAVKPPPKHIFLYQINALLRTNSTLFFYLNPDQREAYRRDFLFAFRQLVTQYQAESLLNKRQHLHQHLRDIRRCAFLLRNLKLAEEQKHLETRMHEDKAYDKEWLNNKIAWLKEFSPGFLVNFQQILKDASTLRGYVSWSNYLTQVATDLLPTDIYNVQRTIDFTTDALLPLRILGSILFFARLLITSLLIVKHSIKGFWMSDEEKELIGNSDLDNLLDQINTEKFSILNDLVWGINNVLGLAALARPAFGPIADGFMICFLFIDTLALRFADKEAKKAHQQQVAIYDEEIERIKKKMDEFKTRQTQLNTRHNEAVILSEELKRLEAAKALCIEDWNAKVKSQTIDYHYALALTVGFIALTLPWADMSLPWLVEHASQIVLGASIFCFGLMLLQTLFKGVIATQKEWTLEERALEECYLILNQSEGFNEVEFIRYQEKKAEAEYQKAMGKYQIASTIRTLVIQSIIPIGLFCGLTFGTSGIAIVVIATVVAVSILTHYLFEYFRPKENELDEFNREAFEAFSPQKELALLEKLFTPSVSPLESLSYDYSNDSSP